MLLWLPADIPGAPTTDIASCEAMGRGSAFLRFLTLSPQYPILPKSLTSLS